MLLLSRDGFIFSEFGIYRSYFIALNFQELVINPITVVDFEAVNVSRNKKNWVGAQCFVWR